MSIYGNVVGASMFTPKSFVLEDENGNSFIGVTIGEEKVLTATDNDVRDGSVYAGDAGVSVGIKNIPAYHTTKASYLILPKMPYSIQLKNGDRYDYTKFQCVIAKRNTNFSDSVAVDKVVLEDNVYEVNSTESLSHVTKNIDTKSIDLNIVNNTDDVYVIHCFTYKEEY